MSTHWQKRQYMTPWDENGLVSHILQLQSKEYILKNVWNQTIDFHRGKKYYRSQWMPSTVWLPTFFKIYSFVFNRGEKLI